VPPDVAVWRGEERARLAREAAARVHLALPTLCVEVLTPATAREARLIKLGLYAQAGVEWIWLVDPAQQSVEIYRGHGGRATLAGGLAGSGAGVLDPFAAECSLASWWSTADDPAAAPDGDE
jgi:hypothetical protein